MAPALVDELNVKGFAERAQELLETALAGPSSCDVTVLIGHDGAVQLCVDSDWPLESLARERGARTVYRVRSHHGAVRVEGREGFRTCVLESGPASMKNLLPKNATHHGGWVV